MYLYIGVLMCMHMSAYVCVCEHMCLLICMWWCRFGVDDGFGIMVVSVVRKYVTEPVDVVLVCDWSCAVCSGWAAACMYRCCGVGCGGVHHHL